MVIDMGDGFEINMFEQLRMSLISRQTQPNPSPLTCQSVLDTKTRGPRTLALCLTAAVGMTLAIFFCRLVSKPHCCRLNLLQTLTQYPTMHVSILDHIRHLNFGLSGPLKVKCECYWTPHIWFPINV